jgi:hypothetical protein
MKINEDLFNRYIDGELRGDEREEFEKMLDSSPELKKKLTAYKLLHSSLLLQKEESPSINFTANVMKKISRASSFNRSQNYFFISVVSVFLMICLGLIGFVVVKYLGSAGESSFTIPDYSENIHSILTYITEKAVVFFNPKYFSMIGYLTASIVLLSGYIFFENLKSLKKIK